ncbi:MAG: hypothetical protein U5N56_08650 [Candidatus Marinimicrobia bacterium]|nr:hypothetical protein [Candidatus Neomarinimicrobiota bacterium]
MKPRLENAYLSVDVNSDGSLDIHCKKSDRKVHKTAYFIDEGESGHAWVHEARGPVLSTEGKAAGIEFLCSEGLIQQLRISRPPEDAKGPLRAG